MGGDRQPTRAAGLSQQADRRTYAGLAAAAAERARDEGTQPRSGSAGGSAGGALHGNPELAGGPRTSAFFEAAQPLGQWRQQAAAARQRPGVSMGSLTPPAAGRVAARIGTPESVASPFLDDDDILFQMSGLKPLRTSSRTAAAAAAGARSHRKPQARREAVPGGDSWSPGETGAAAAAARPSKLSPAFGSGGVSPEAGLAAAPAPAVDTFAEDVAAAAARWSPGTRLFASPGAPSASAAHADVGRSSRSTNPQCESAEEKAEASDAAAAPGWSEELLNWMLSEKAGLLVEAQRAARRQQELEAELSRQRAHAAGVERDAQRLSAERRSLLERVQQLSAAEADAAARVERLTMENDALNAELERSQEVCREMLAARRAARDALSEMSAQNARLLAAYVDKKQEAAHLREELQRQQHESEARMQALEAQLHAARASRRGLLGSLCSPPASPPGANSPDSARSTHSTHSPQDGIATPRGLQAEASAEDGLPNGSSSYDEGLQHHSGTSPFLNKENASANASGRHGAGCSRVQRPDKGEWDEERNELLGLLERLQGQLQAHADQQAAAACDGTPAPLRQQQRGTPGHSPAPPSPRVPTHGQQAGRQQQQPAAHGSLSGAPLHSSAEASFDSAGEGATCESPAVVAHHVDDSPLPPTSASRSTAPSPPSARAQRPVHAASPGVGDAASSEQRPAGGATASRPIPLPQAQQQPKLSTSVGRTLDAFFGSSPVPGVSPPGPAAAPTQQSVQEQERLQQAEQRAAELEAEVERLRQANAAAEEKVRHEERRRAAETAKASGNAAFQAQNFELALQHYSAGLEGLLAGRTGRSSGGGGAPELDGVDAALAAVLHCNRAAAHQSCGRFLHALADCFKAELSDPSYARIYHRRADAHWAIGAWDAAAQDLSRLLELGAGQDVAARLVEAQRRSQAGQPASYYSVLGLRPAATPGEVKTAYRQLAKAFHPDKAQAAGLAPEAAHALFKLLSEAATALSDAEQRRQHDIATLRHKYRRHYAAAF